jgi:hypothetical protein
MNRKALDGTDYLKTPGAPGVKLPGIPRSPTQALGICTFRAGPPRGGRGRRGHSAATALLHYGALGVLPRDRGGDQLTGAPSLPRRSTRRPATVARHVRDRGQSEGRVDQRRAQPQQDQRSGPWGNAADEAIGKCYGFVRVRHSAVTRA